MTLSLTVATRLWILQASSALRQQDVHQSDVDRLEAEAVATVIRQLLKLKHERVLLSAGCNESGREPVDAKIGRCGPRTPITWQALKCILQYFLEVLLIQVCKLRQEFHRAGVAVVDRISLLECSLTTTRLAIVHSGQPAHLIMDSHPNPAHVGRYVRLVASHN